MRMRIRSQESLRRAIVSGYRGYGEADFCADPAPVFIPGVLRQEVCCEAARDTEFRRVRFTDSLTVHCARHRVEQISHEDAFGRMPAIDGGDHVEVVVVDRTGKPLEPIGFYRCRIR